MIVEQPEADLKLPKGFIPFQDQYLRNIMDVRTPKNHSSLPRKTGAPLIQGKRTEFKRSFSQGQGRKFFSASYFSMQSMLLLVCLTVSLLFLPLILPPLPPPPFMLLLLPICILAVLMILAFMPSNIRDVTHAYV